MSISKKILIHSIAFSPDCVSTAYLYNDIALGFKENGYEPVILTTTPHYNRIESELAKQPLQRKLFGIYFESNYNGIKVLHVPQKKYKSMLARISGMAYWHILTIILGICQRNIKLVLSVSPPLSIGLVSALIGKIKRVKTVYNVQEIYPDLLIDHKNLKNPLIIKILRLLERLVYNWSDSLVVIDEAFSAIIEDRVKNPSKINIIPNFVDTQIYKPISQKQLLLDRKVYPDNDSLKMMYAGNIGYAQEWEIFIRLAQDMRKYNIEYWAIGDGVLRDKLERDIKNLKLNKIHLVPYQPRELMPYLTSYADIHFIFMNQKLEEHGFPSKIYTIMACGKPLIIASGVNTPLYNFFKNLDCSFLITTNNLEERYEALKKILMNLLKNREIIKTKGLESLSLIKSKYCKEIVVARYISLVDELMKKQ